MRYTFKRHDLTVIEAQNGKCLKESIQVYERTQPEQATDFVEYDPQVIVLIDQFPYGKVIQLSPALVETLARLEQADRTRCASPDMVRQGQEWFIRTRYLVKQTNYATIRS